MTQKFRLSLRLLLTTLLFAPAIAAHAIAPSSTTALSVPVSPGIGVATTLTVTVSGNAGTPTGSVQVYVGTSPIGSAFLSSGSASIAYTFTSATLTNVYAVYAGDGTYLGSQSSAVFVTPVTSTYSASASPNALTITRGQTASSTITLTPTGYYSGTAAFSCTGLPANATCTFAPATVVMAGDNATQMTVLTVATTAPHTITAKDLSSILWLPGIALAGLIALRRRSFHAATRSVLLLLILTGVGLSLTACSSGGATADGSTPVGTSVATVNVSAAVGAGTPTAQSASITITIQ